MQRARALIVFVSGELHVIGLKAKMLQDPMLEFVVEYLPVAVHNELIPDAIEDDAALRPLFVLGIPHDFNETVRWRACSPAFP